jgi:transposase
LSEVQLPAEQRRALLDGVFNGTQKLEPVHRPARSAAQQPELIAEGFRYDVALSAEVGARRVRWQERRWVVRSVAHARAQEEKLDTRLGKAKSQLEHLSARKQGKKRLSAQELAASAAQILATNKVEGLLVATVRTTTTAGVRRRYGPRPQQPVQEASHRVEVVRQEQAIARAKQALGWQVYATNNRQLSLLAVVLGYRGQYQVEEYWSRMKGRSLSLSPMYLATDSRLKGLVNLLSLAVRVLTLLEWVVRRKLEQSVFPKKNGAEVKGGFGCTPVQTLPGRRTPREE